MATTTQDAPKAPRSSPPADQPGGVGVRLSVMMFLQYAVWGIWLPYLANYLVAPVSDGGLGFSGAQMGWILGLAASLGAISAPFIAGQVADRYLNAERALALLILVGGIIKYATAYTTDYAAFLFLSIAYSIAYMPTLSLTNSLSFQNLDDPERRFPFVRVWGTIGWIAASTIFPLVWLTSDVQAVNTARLADALKVSGVLSVAYAVYCLVVLPKTPPKRDVARPALSKAFALLRHPAFLVATLVALPISMIHQAYFIRIGPFLENDTGLPLKWVGPVLSIGQWSEIAFLAILGFLIKRLGYKWVLALGCLAYVLRFAIFAVGQPAPLIIAAQALHGLCYGCFFAGAYLCVERVAPPDVRHSAQTVFGIIILGLGPVLAGFYNGYFDRFTKPDGTQAYEQFWWTQAVLAIGSLIVLMLAFPRRVEPADVVEPSGFPVAPLAALAGQEGRMPADPVPDDATR